MCRRSEGQKSKVVCVVRRSSQALTFDFRRGLADEALAARCRSYGVGGLVALMGPPLFILKRTIEPQIIRGL